MGGTDTLQVLARKMTTTKQSDRFRVQTKRSKDALTSLVVAP